jgi:hypothetical protein
MIGKSMQPVWSGPPRKSNEFTVGERLDALWPVTEVDALRERQDAELAADSARQK